MKVKLGLSLHWTPMENKTQLQGKNKYAFSTIYKWFLDLTTYYVFRFIESKYIMINAKIHFYRNFHLVICFLSYSGSSIDYNVLI
jgi:hypothetical protein